MVKLLTTTALFACSLLSLPAFADALPRPPVGFEDDGQGALYLQALVEEIRSADRILVTEHSFHLDAYDVEQQRSLLEETVIYDSKDLDDRQRVAFERSIAALNPATQNMYSLCLFEPHHTVTFFQMGEVTSSLEICFECAKVSWDGSSATPPWSIYDGLRRFISEIGLQPDRDWHQLALEQVQ